MVLLEREKIAEVNQTETDGSFRIETGHAPKLIMAKLKLKPGQAPLQPRILVSKASHG
jgi:hypothetical protein